MQSLKLQRCDLYSVLFLIFLKGQRSEIYCKCLRKCDWLAKYFNSFLKTNLKKPTGTKNFIDHYLNFKAKYDLSTIFL